MDFDHKTQLCHFQLRNLMACASRDHIFYADRSKVRQWNPHSRNPATVAMDLTEPVVQSVHVDPAGIYVSTLAVAHGILVAGGLGGEYSLVNLRGPKDAAHTEGLVTDHHNSITNHVQVHLSRGSNRPLATFASNDSGIRVLDVSTNTFVAEHAYEHAINCTAVSPDQRLRVLVGDTNQVMICNADTGEVLQSLEGHRDYGFACDWADDGWTVATGNQDMQVKIWDARKWTDRQGVAQPIATIAAEMAGVRKLKFSPLGSGKRVLVAAEPADIVNVIDGQTCASKQTLSFFGEIGGVDFTNDGQDLIVANCDAMRGGIMAFERCDLAGGASGLDAYTEGRSRRHRARWERDGYDWLEADDDLTSHPKSRGTGEQRRRKAAGLGINMGYF
jgi:WD40 repeat protein